MWKLMQLEWRKNNVKRYAVAAVALAAILALFLFALAFLGIAVDPDTGVLDAAPGSEAISASVELFTSMVYLVFTSVMLSAFIVRAYQNKTMALMFSYPIKRQKILVSQMLAVWLFAFAALALTKLFIYACLSVGGRFFPSPFLLDMDLTSVGFYLQLVGKAAVIVSMGFIALFVGLAMKSGAAAIVSSFLLILLTQANVGDLTMANSALFPALLTAISLLFAFLAVRGVERRDLM